jgi:Zn-dependent M28 family amino/carboxypeptidase
MLSRPAAATLVWIGLSVAGPAAWRQQVAVDTSQLMRDVSVLAADDMEGRLVGSAGSAKARAYILGRFREAGIQAIGNDYERPFTYKSGETERRGVNLVGIVTGSQDRDHVIVLTAHYDHIGIRNGEVFNGADDNASGVAALLAAAASLSRDKPRHSIVIAALDAEESGLHGARAFMADPPVPRAAIALNLNLDMVGRDAANTLYAVGTHQYPFLKPYLERVAQPPVKLILGHDVPGAKEEDWTKDSDHYVFHQAGIPFVYFGVEDFAQHHRATDDAATITKEFFAGAAATIIAAVRLFDQNLEEIRKQTPAR